MPVTRNKSLSVVLERCVLRTNARLKSFKSFVNSRVDMYQSRLHHSRRGSAKVSVRQCYTCLSGMYVLCIVARISRSTGLRSGLFGGQKSSRIESYLYYLYTAGRQLHEHDAQEHCPAEFQQSTPKVFKYYQHVDVIC